MEIESLHHYGDLYWHGCYTSFRRWGSYITSKSYAHPAKMSPKLCEKIFKHLKKHGLLKESDIVCDFMAGIGTTNVIASLHRMKSISIELEPHFIEMEKEVKEKLEKSLGKVDWEIVQGDSRNLSEIIKERCVGLVSPPYSNLWNKNNTENIEENVQKRLKRCTEKGEIETANRIKRALKGEDHSDVSKDHRYSKDPKNIGNLPDKTMVGIISPPYSESQSGGGIAKKGYTGKFINIQGNPDRVSDRCGYVREKHMLPENIANLPDKNIVGVVSPPYIGTVNKDGGGKIFDYQKVGISTRTLRKYSKNPDNIGNLPDRIVGITSLPYAEMMHKKHTEKSTTIYEDKHLDTKYSQNPQNIGNLPDKVVGIVSPPYENSEGTKAASKFKNVKEFAQRQSEGYNKKGRECHSASPEALKQYMEKVDDVTLSENNIGSEREETYLDAMFRVYTEAFNTGISPLVVVTKNPTRDGKLRRLDIDTVNLLMAAGYEIIDYHRAVLFKEQKYWTLDGKIIKHPKGRVGFFKRLAYQKGSEIARWEDVFIAVIPSAGDITYSKQDVKGEATS